MRRASPVVLALAVALCLPLISATGVRAQDADDDGVPDSGDNCLHLFNSSQCDTDSDGYGNACDGDFNQNLVVQIQDRQLLGDMDCNGETNANDYDYFWLPQFEQGHPGPSGLACAGSPSYS